MTEILELSDRVTMIIFQQANTHTGQIFKKSTINLSKEIEDIKNEMKIFDIRVEGTEKRISELEDRTTDIT